MLQSPKNFNNQQKIINNQGQRIFNMPDLARNANQTNAMPSTPVII
jgi:hypothetical protein